MELGHDPPSPGPYDGAYGAFGGFEAWYADNHARVLHVVTVVSGDADAAREATDEAFASALARWNRVRAMSSPTGWTCRVALNDVRRRSGGGDGSVNSWR